MRNKINQYKSMFNKSEIFKAAHAKAKYDRETWPRLHKDIPYRETFALCLKSEWGDALHAARYGRQETTPELKALEAEHYRRDVSCAAYFGSKAYRETQSKITELKQAA